MLKYIAVETIIIKYIIIILKYAIVETNHLDY